MMIGCSTGHTSRAANPSFASTHLTRERLAYCKLLTLRREAAAAKQSLETPVR